MAAPDFDNSYARLPAQMFTRVQPQAAPAAQLITLNRPLARRLGLDENWLAGQDGRAMLSGNQLPKGADPIAQAYAGHQFGGFSPQLGDGRAVLLGEVLAPDGARFDLQLKGAGRTPFSRRGDGQAVLGPVLREYLVSEFMAATGIPTTRALAAMTTGHMVMRDSLQPGAVLTRIAASHIRVGTFEYFAARNDLEALTALTEHAIARHAPDADGPLGLLKTVIAKQAVLVAGWMGLGFVHGVMNTDNMAISGETIDYGPCAFIDAFHPDRVFSSIDQRGRYAWSNQPQIAVWNLAQLASALLPLIGEGEAAIAEATAAVHSFPALYHAEFERVFAAKLGLHDAALAAPLVTRLLELMTKDQADFTRVFAALGDGNAHENFTDQAAFGSWAQEWRAAQPDPALLAATNPRRIPRNHQIEKAITAALAGDFAPFHLLDAALHAPFEDCAAWDALAQPPEPQECVERTFCGT